MKRSILSSSPVITFLSPSPAASRHARDLLSQWTSLESVVTAATDSDGKEGSITSRQDATLVRNDEWDSLFRSNFLRATTGSSITWDSVAAKCQANGTILHWLSIDDKKYDGNHNYKKSNGNASSFATKAGGASNEQLSLPPPHQLIAVQETSSVWHARNMLAASLADHVSFHKIAISNALGQPVKATHLLPKGNNGIPILDLSALSFETTTQVPTPATAPSHRPAPSAGSLKELVIPTNGHDALSANLFFSISQSPLTRPVTGLYQFPANGLCLRPLPAGERDRKNASILPSLIFHSNDVCEQPLLDASHGGTQTAKIGYNGKAKGQLMVRHDALTGLDVRFCGCDRHSSMFAEAQESLFAGSLEELQSKHVLQEGGVDPKTNNVDCWIEFRATMANPSGFLSNTARSKIPIVNTSE